MDKIIEACIFLTKEDQEFMKKYMDERGYDMNAALSVFVGLGIEAMKDLLKDKK